MRSCPSIKVVKGFAREPHELQRFKRAGNETMSARLRYTWQESLFTLVVTADHLDRHALVLAVGGLHVLRGDLTRRRAAGRHCVSGRGVRPALVDRAHDRGAAERDRQLAARPRDFLRSCPNCSTRRTRSTRPDRRRHPLRERQLLLRRRTADSPRRQLQRAAWRDGRAGRPDRRRQDQRWPA